MLEQVAYLREIFIILCMASLASFRSKTVCLSVFYQSVKQACVCLCVYKYVWIYMGCACVCMYLSIYMYIYIHKKERAKSRNLQKAGKYQFVTVLQRFAVMDLILQEVTKKGYGRIERAKQRGGLLRGILENALPRFSAPSLTAWLV